MTAYRAPDGKRAREQEILAAFDAETRGRRARARDRVRRARAAGLFVSGVCVALFATAMAAHLTKTGLSAHGLRPLLVYVAIVLLVALLVRRARIFVRSRVALTRQKHEADISARVAEQVRAARDASALEAAAESRASEAAASLGP